LLFLKEELEPTDDTDDELDLDLERDFDLDLDLVCNISLDRGLDLFLVLDPEAECTEESD